MKTCIVAAVLLHSVCFISIEIEKRWLLIRIHQRWQILQMPFRNCTLINRHRFRFTMVCQRQFPANRVFIHVIQILKIMISIVQWNPFSYLYEDRKRCRYHLCYR